MLDAVQGQDEGVRYLRRVVSGHVTSPLLLVGQEGVGKRLAVLSAAKEFFTKGDATDVFHIRHVDAGTHPDLTVIQPDEGLIKVDAIRELTSEVGHAPSYSSARYVVIDGADCMNAASANAFLKTLEEPPRTVRFFLLAQSQDGVLPTIRSRCGLVRFRPLPEAFILARIPRRDTSEVKALVLTRLAEGSVGRALDYWSKGRLRLRDAVLSLLKPSLLQSPFELFSAVDAIGADLALGLRFLEHILHDILMISVAPARITNVDVEDQIRALHAALGPDHAYKLALRIRGVQTYLDRGVRVVLPAHVKSALVGVGS